MRKALVVGINYYGYFPQLFGCVRDALEIKEVLAKHGDGTVNFAQPTLLTASSRKDAITKQVLKDHVEALFAGNNDIALFYFAGHGDIDATGGYLCCSDGKRGDDGLSLGDVMTLAKNSRAKNKIIVLDSCFSGAAGTRPTDPRAAELWEGMTILTASTNEQYATETNGSGVFTSLFVDALRGGAGNLLGDVTPGGIYAHIDQSLGPWRQRPIFRTNVESFVSLRRVKPPIGLEDLHRLTELFPTSGTEFMLDPSFEPEVAGRPEGAPPPDLRNTEKFAVLQKYNRVNLVVPVDAPHMWHAAMERKSCKLTVLGKHYRRLVEDGLI